MPNVYLFRQTLDGRNRVVELLNDGHIAIGWSLLTRGTALDPSVTKDRLNVELTDRYPNLIADKKITRGVNQLWRFLKDLKVGDIVIAPKGEDIYFATISGAPIYIEGRDDDTSIRRPVVPHPRSPVKRYDLPEMIREKLVLRGHASFDLEAIKDEVLTYLGLDPQIITAIEQAAEEDRLLREALGPYTISAKDERIIDPMHPKVSFALTRHLNGKGLRVANAPTDGLIPDLFTLCDADPMLFEIKTGNGSGDYLKALGQLLYYEKQKKRTFRKFLVAPAGIKNEVKANLGEFDIGIIEYSQNDDVFDFRWP